MSKSADSKNNSVVLTNPERRLFGRGFYGVVIVILFGLFAFQLWFHAIRTSATIDEPLRILAGYQHWCGDFGINPQHPPLFKMLATMPLLGKALLQPPWDCGSQITSQADAYFFGNLFLAENGADKVVIPARLSAALTSVLLASLVFLAANEMFGRWAGLPALGLLVFEPNIIAHGSLVTTDMPVTLGFFAAVYALYRYVKIPTILRFLAVGVGVGLSLAAKHSAVLIFPVFVLLLVGDLLLFRCRSFENKPPLVKEFSARVGACAGFFLIGFTILWATYGFRYFALPIATTNTLSVEDRVNNLRSGHIMALINQMRVLPESYVYGLTDVVATWRRPTYIFDRFYPTGIWFYFPLAFVVKTSIALLFLLGIGLSTLRLYRDHAREMLFLLLPSFVYFGLCLFSGINIGVRHLLPVYPFFIVTAAGGISFWSRKYRAVKYMLIALLLFHALAAARTAPNYVAFANDFWGGTNNSYRIFRYSNVEYQQNFKLVAEYIARENIRGCWFAAYGSNELARAYQPCKMMPALLGLWSTLNVSEQVEEPVLPIIEGTVFLSVTVLPPAPFPEYLPIAQTTPVAQIGGSIFVYRGRFEVPLVAALSHTSRVRQLVRRERFEEAVADGRRAVELAPEDPRTHFWLGMALAHNKQREEARRELETVLQLRQSDGDYVLRGLRQNAEKELKLLK